MFKEILLLNKIKRKSKKILKRIKGKISNKKQPHPLNYIQELNLEKISKITGLKIPKEYKNMKLDYISQVTFSTDDIKSEAICFVVNPKFVDVKKIVEKAKFVVTKTPIEGCNNIICEKPYKYGKEYFKFLRNSYNPKVISVTGSIGKTSTKEVIESVLREKYNDALLSSIGNSNSFRRVSENIKKLTKETKILLQEVGAGSSAYNTVKNSAKILEPNIAVYTNIKDSHIEWFGTRENIAKEKFTLSDYGKKDGLAVVNYDDPILRNAKFKQRKISYSLNNKNADVYAKNIKITSDGTSFTIVNNLKKYKMNVELKVIGEQHVINSLVAYIVAKEFKIKNEVIKTGLSKYKTQGERQNLIDVGKYKILADCYNSSYDALSFILKTFKKMEPLGNGRKFVVVGDVLELGKESKRIHKQIGELLSKYKFENVFFIGEEVKYSYEEYKIKRKNGFYANTREELIDIIKSKIKMDDIILFKASHGMHFAELIDTLFGTEIGEKTFISHKDFSEFKKDNMVYNLYSNHSSLKKYLGNSKKVIIPDFIENLKVEMIGVCTFYKNKTIEEVTLPTSLVRIRKSSFSYSPLKKININENLKSIGEEAFNFCSNLEKVILPEGMLFIEIKAFANCNNLKEVYIPNSVKKISKYAFFRSKNVIIKCHDKSYALTYAKKRDIKYEIID